MKQQPLFLCHNCGCDTLTQQHASTCEVYRTEAQRQTVEKMKEFGMAMTPALQPIIYPDRLTFIHEVGPP